MTFGKFMRGFLGIAEKAAPVAAALVGGPVAGAALKGIAIVHDTVEAATQPDQTKTDLAITAALGALQETGLRHFPCLRIRSAKAISVLRFLGASRIQHVVVYGEGGAHAA